MERKPYIQVKTKFKVVSNYFTKQYSTLDYDAVTYYVFCYFIVLLDLILLETLHVHVIEYNTNVHEFGLAELV